jgi:hypothetical protein
VPPTAHVDTCLLQEVLGKKKWTDIASKTCTNAYRPDIHFLPADSKPPSWSAIPEHSVVLFRYPLTAPIELFDAANDINLAKVLSSSQQHSPLLDTIRSSDTLLDTFSTLLVTEIGAAIKGHGFERHRKRYVESERPLSHLHSALNPTERAVVFSIFEGYHDCVFRREQLLDSDDVALSLLGPLRVPLWQMQRKDQGVDYLFVDETQLFNENERRIFSLITKGITDYVPIAIALDEAQQLSGAFPAGFGALGIDSIAQESLHTMHRCTPAILQLAFMVIQRSTDLFGPEFPDFTSTTPQRCIPQLAYERATSLTVVPKHLIGGS